MHSERGRPAGFHRPVLHHDATKHLGKYSAFLQIGHLSTLVMLLIDFAKIVTAQKKFSLEVLF